MKRFVAEGLNERCCVFEVLIPTQHHPSGNDCCGERGSAIAMMLAPASAGAPSTNNKKLSASQELGFEQDGAASYSFFLTLSELE
jgi:hypothetical protein